MNPTAINPLAAQWMACLFRACWQGSLACIAVWAICRLFPRLPHSLRTLLWWLACLKMIVSLAVNGPIPIAILPPEKAFPARIAPAPLPLSPRTLTALPQVTPLQPVPTLPAPAVVPASERISPLSILLIAWIIGILVLLTAVCRELSTLRRLMQKASAYPEASLVETVAHAIGLRAAPPVLLSTEADSSFVVGLWRPTIVLAGSDLAHLSGAERQALLAHELSHIRRQDLLAGVFPNLARLLFFFHPFIWLACREYDLAREAACDAEALRVSGMTPAEYGRLLLKLGIAPSATPTGSGRVALGAASPYGVHLRRRLADLRHRGNTASSGSGLLALLGTLCLLTLHPIRSGAGSRIDAPAPLPDVAASALLSLAPVPSPDQTLQRYRNVPVKKEEKMKLKLPIIRKPNLSPVLAAVTVTTAIAPNLLAAAPVSPQESPVAPIAPVVPAAPIAPVPAVAPLENAAPIAPPDAPESLRTPYPYTLRRGDSYMVRAKDKVASAQRDLAKAQTGDCLVVDKDGKRYLITDAGVLRQIQEALAPIDAIGKQMEGKGKEMESVSKPMEALGKEMEALGNRMEELGKQMEEQGNLLEAAVSGGKSEEERKAIQEQMKAIQQKMKAPQEEMQALSQKMRDQSGKMRPLGDQMREHGRRMRDAFKEAEGKITGIIESAFAKNLAVEQKTS